ncbi:MAG TPA: substrate-binding domain-containing protein, partial [Polyangia bacterium]|nr:substrate-binding domain-containing protein [Polyangia bacterium]
QPLIDAGRVHVVVEKSHDSWSPEQALKTVEDAIAKTKGDIAAILANNSGMARGAVQAVQAAKLAHVFIAGADADAANVEYVCEGKQSVEVLKAIKPLAERAAEVASELARTGMVAGPSGKTQVAAVVVNLVDPANARALVIDSGFQSASALPACK